MRIVGGFRLKDLFVLIADALGFVLMTAFVWYMLVYGLHDLIEYVTK